MSITPTDGIAPGILSPSATSFSTTTGTSEDHQMFLDLMVAQLRYQDPMNPADSGEFLSQSAQFTALEKMQDVADQTAALVSAQMAFGASNLIGQTVRWTDENGVEQSGTVQGTTFLPTGPMLSVDGHEVPLMNVLSVGDAPTIEPDDPTGDVGTPPSGTPPTDPPTTL